ncbi:MAG TPA: hypothetical protein VM537_29645, partial [Anaerolineae bacterium]|nr:hypothetical protein [Anaerolineae bacterium]
KFQAGVARLVDITRNEARVEGEKQGLEGDALKAHVDKAEAATRKIIEERGSAFQPAKEGQVVAEQVAAGQRQAPAVAEPTLEEDLAALDAGQEAPTAAPEATPAEQGVPTMITRDMDAKLQALGYTAEAIGKLTPQAAWDILQAGQQAEGPLPSAFPEGVPAKDAPVTAKEVIQGLQADRARAAAKQAPQAAPGREAAPRVESPAGPSPSTLEGTPDALGPTSSRVEAPSSEAGAEQATPEGQGMGMLDPANPAAARQGRILQAERPVAAGLVTEHGRDLSVTTRELADNEPPAGWTLVTLESARQRGLISQATYDRVIFIHSMAEGLPISLATRILETVSRVTEKDLATLGEAMRINLDDVVKGETRAELEDGIVKATIQLYLGHDRTTGPHEWGHVFRIFLRKVAEHRPEAKELLDAFDAYALRKNPGLNKLGPNKRQRALDHIFGNAVQERWDQKQPHEADSALGRFFTAARNLVLRIIEALGSTWAQAKRSVETAISPSMQAKFADAWFKGEPTRRPAHVPGAAQTGAAPWGLGGERGLQVEDRPTYHVGLAPLRERMPRGTGESRVSLVAKHLEARGPVVTAFWKDMVGGEKGEKWEALLKTEGAAWTLYKVANAPGMPKLDVEDLAQQTLIEVGVDLAGPGAEEQVARVRERAAEIGRTPEALFAFGIHEANSGMALGNDSPVDAAANVLRKGAKLMRRLPERPAGASGKRLVRDDLLLAAEDRLAEASAGLEDKVGAIWERNEGLGYAGYTGARPLAGTRNARIISGTTMSWLASNPETKAEVKELTERANQERTNVVRLILAEGSPELRDWLGRMWSTASSTLYQYGLFRRDVAILRGKGLPAEEIFRQLLPHYTDADPRASQWLTLTSVRNIMGQYSTTRREEGADVPQPNINVWPTVGDVERLSWWEMQPGWEETKHAVSSVRQPSTGTPNRETAAALALRQEVIADMLGEGFSSRIIADKIGWRSNAMVLSVRNEAGISGDSSARSHSVDYDIVEQIWQRHDDGENNMSIARSVGVGRTTVARVLARPRVGIERRTAGHATTVASVGTPIGSTAAQDPSALHGEIAEEFNRIRAEVDITFETEEAIPTQEQVRLAGKQKETKEHGTDWLIDWEYQTRRPGEQGRNSLVFRPTTTSTRPGEPTRPAYATGPSLEQARNTVRYHRIGEVAPNLRARIEAEHGIGVLDARGQAIAFDRVMKDGTFSPELRSDIDEFLATGKEPGVKPAEEPERASPEFRREARRRRQEEGGRVNLQVEEGDDVGEPPVQSDLTPMQEAEMRKIYPRPGATSSLRTVPFIEYWTLKGRSPREIA